MIIYCTERVQIATLEDSEDRKRMTLYSLKGGIAALSASVSSIQRMAGEWQSKRLSSLWVTTNMNESQIKKPITLPQSRTHEEILQKNNQSMENQ